jgi:phosphatidylserine/phosphatidylglycerophosphate/cardiolipin synthase-like enzyme
MVDKNAVAMMQQAGVAFQEYRPLRWYDLGRLNKCTHRKLLMVDGRIGFTGGSANASRVLGQLGEGRRRSAPRRRIFSHAEVRWQSRKSGFQ